MIRFLQHLDECSGGHPAPAALPSRPRRSKGFLAGALRPILNPKPEIQNSELETRNPKFETKSEPDCPVRLLSPIALTTLRRARSSSNLRETEAGPPEARNLSEARNLLRASSITFFRNLASNGSKGLASKTRGSSARVWPAPAIALQ